MQTTTARSVLRLTALTATAAATLWLAGCASTSTQADANKGAAPIAQAKPSTNNANANGANNNGVPSTAVAPVDLSKGNGQGSNAAADAGLARVVYFDFDSNVIKDEFRGVVEGNAKRLSADGARKVVIEGNTDERGGREYNLALGQRRAESVQKALVLLGANANQLEAVSFGKERPAVQGSNEEAWSKNRRAEIKDR
jgi:peptidoglycan-associated lipoprotein